MAAYWHVFQDFFESLQDSFWACLFGVECTKSCCRCCCRECTCCCDSAVLVIDNLDESQPLLPQSGGCLFVQSSLIFNALLVWITPNSTLRFVVSVTIHMSSVKLITWTILGDVRVHRQRFLELSEKWKHCLEAENLGFIKTLDHSFAP